GSKKRKRGDVGNVPPTSARGRKAPRRMRAAVYALVGGFLLAFVVAWNHVRAVHVEAGTLRTPSVVTPERSAYLADQAVHGFYDPGPLTYQGYRRAARLLGERDYLQVLEETKVASREGRASPSEGAYFGRLGEAVMFTRRAELAAKASKSGRLASVAGG